MKDSPNQELGIDNEIAFINGKLNSSRHSQEEPTNNEDKEYIKTHRESFIDELIQWISEANSPLLDTNTSVSSIVLMKQDLQYLMSLPDEYILSSSKTNNYIAKSDDPFLYRDTLRNNTQKDI